MSLERLDDWDLRLNELVADRGNSPFSWGANDCILFACDCILAITGTDLAAEFRGKYRTRLQAARILKDFGGLERLADSFAAKHEIPRLEFPALAQRGDVGLVESGHGLALTVVADRYVVAPGASALEFIPFSRLTRAWRI